MAWTTELVTQLRYIINDLDATAYTWTDLQLQQFIGLSAVMTGTDLSKWGFPTFAFDASIPTLDPDPTDSIYDDFVGLLIVVKAACLITNAEMKKVAAQSGFIVVDDKSKIETKDQIASAAKAAEKFCGDYTAAKESYKESVAFTGTHNGLGILAPYADLNYG